MTAERWDALHGWWDAVCQKGPVGPIRTLEPWRFFYKWVFDTLAVLDMFAQEVVTARRDTGLRNWARWMQEDLDQLLGFIGLCCCRKMLLTCPDY